MVNVGIAGIGFMGMIHYLAYQKVRGVRSRRCASRTRSGWPATGASIKGNFGPPGQMMDLSGIARYRRLDEMLADPSAGHDRHLPAAVAARRDHGRRHSKAGKHVFCEKPIALNAAERTAWSRPPSAASC